MSGTTLTAWEPSAVINSLFLPLRGSSGDSICHLHVSIHKTVVTAKEKSLLYQITCTVKGEWGLTISRKKEKNRSFRNSSFKFKKSL